MPAIKFTTFRNGVIASTVALLGGFGWLLFKPSNAQVKPTAPTTINANSDSVVVPVSRDLRPVDRDILTYLAQPASGNKVKDAFPNQTYKVSFYRDSGSTWNRLKIDLNRNGKWDEKWTIENGSLNKRQVSSQDNEQYDQQYRWRGARWEIKK
jgi:hypothetical protein